jgi:hypothetical protein
METRFLVENEMARYATLEEVLAMDAQAAFNHVARHLLTQYRQCTVTGSKVCLYRGIHGDACGVGALIPDALYTREMEQKQAGALVYWCLERGGIYSVLGRALARFTPMLDILQHVHDHLEPSQWWCGLQRVAADFDLCPDVLREFPRERDPFDVPAPLRLDVATLALVPAWSAPVMLDHAAFERFMTQCCAGMPVQPVGLYIEVAT